MVCIYCGGKTKTNNSRSRAKGLATWRRKECFECSAIYTTLESVELSSAIRIKKNDVLEPFIYEKLFIDLYDSLSHRKNAYKDARGLSSTILSKLLPAKGGVISIEEMKHAVLEVLKRFDKAAFTYFQAHHPIS